MKKAKKVPNKHRVDPLVWQDEWSESGRQLFNDLYEFLSETEQGIIMHPKAEPIKKSHWRTLAWNVAWIAADFENEIRTEVEK